MPPRGCQHLSMALQNRNITMVVNLLNKLLQSVIKIQQCSINATVCCDDAVAVFFSILLNPNGFVHGQCFDCILWQYFVGSPFWWLVWQNYSHNSVPLILQNKTTKKIQTEDISDPVCLRKMQHYNILVINSLQLIQYSSVRCLHCMPSKIFHL